MSFDDWVTLTLTLSIPLAASYRDTCTPLITMCHNVACGDLGLDWLLWLNMMKEKKLENVIKMLHSFCFHLFLSQILSPHFLFWAFLLSFSLFSSPLSSSPPASRVFLTAGFTDMCLPTTGWETLITQSSAVQIFQTVSISDLNHWKLTASLIHGCHKLFSLIWAPVT